MSRTSCADGWCDQSSGYMIERNNCQDQVAEHSPGLSSVKSAVSGFYVLRFPYFQSYCTVWTDLMSEEGGSRCRGAMLTPAASGGWPPPRPCPRSADCKWRPSGAAEREQDTEESCSSPARASSYGSYYVL